MRKFFRVQFVRYVAVGICNTAFGYGVYAVLLFYGFEFQIASFLSLIIGIAVSFITQGNVVFGNATPATFVRFVAAWLFIYVFNISIIAGLIRASLSAYTAGAIATIPVTLASYFILKYVVFRQCEPSHPVKPAE